MPFLSGKNLADKIKEITKGKNPCCAVAFWGKNSLSLFKKTEIKNLKIICDLTSGGTNPAALAKLKKTNQIHCLPDAQILHAKMYISDSGCVVASANASDRALNFKNGTPVNYEAGFFYSPDTKEYNDVKNEFQTLWKKSRKPTQTDWDTAYTKFSKRGNIQGTITKPEKIENSLLSEIENNPEQFSETSILFTQSRAYKSSEIKDILENISECLSEKTYPDLTHQKILDWDQEFVTWVWDKKSLDECKNFFIWIHLNLNNKKPEYWLCKKEYVLPYKKTGKDNYCLLSENLISQKGTDKKTLPKAFQFSFLPDKNIYQKNINKVIKTDKTRLKELFKLSELEDGKIINSEELINFLNMIPSSSK